MVVNWLPKRSTGDDSAVEAVENVDSVVLAEDTPLDESEGECTTVSAVPLTGSAPSFCCNTAKSWLTRFWTEVTGSSELDGGREAEGSPSLDALLVSTVIVGPPCGEGSDTELRLPVARDTVALICSV